MPDLQVKHIFYSLLGTLLLLILSCQSSSDTGVNDLPHEIDFNQHIKPILSDRCFACHGPDKNKREADLRLDIPEGALTHSLESGNKAFVPGNPGKSEAFQRMISQDPNNLMPPPESHLTLSKKEIALIEKWIESGATYQPHWAFIPPKKRELPEVSNSNWVENPIDQFVLAKLDEIGKSPNSYAEKEVLLRRVYLDLIGLPPTPEEIEDFLSDNSPNAYERVVDRLLQSPQYGERMALPWLDASRYTDSHGYSQDGYREMYPWRDWVINAFNQNIPFDNFIVWQLAGDKISNSSTTQKLATGFLRNHRINTEGGIVFEEYRVENVADRTQTTATAFLGLTFECARCHDHKYDPISQKDYYQLFSFFNQVNEEGLGRMDGNSGPEVLLPSKEVEAKIAFLEKAITKQRRRLKRIRNLHQAPTPIPSDSIVDLSKGLIMLIDTEKQWMTTNNGSITSIQDQASKYIYKTIGDPVLEKKDDRMGIKLDGYNMITNTEQHVNFEQSQPFSFAFWLQAYPQTDFMEIVDRINVKYGLENGYDISVTEGKLNFRLAHSLPANLLEVRSAETLPENQWTHVTITYDGSGKAEGVNMYFNGDHIQNQIVFDQLRQTTRHPRRMTIGGIMHLDENVDDGHFYIDDFRVYDHEIHAAIAKSLAGISIPKQKVISEMAFDRSPDYQLTRDSIQLLNSALTRIQDSITSVMVMEDLVDYRQTFILDRGVYNAPTDEVHSITPESLSTFTSEFSGNRLDLAQWLIHPEHPLTSRVIVNRFWYQLFGKGIVTTVEDFGSQGDLPSHPQLLDWLAITFVESGWDVKYMMKLMVMSSTYRQSSRVSVEERTNDPENKWLARGPSFRLPAELIRDNALAASGLLNKEIGGPSVKPYQPPGLWSESSTFSKVLRTYQQDHGDDLYRRSLYTFWRRTIHHPVMAVFDAPNRDNCIVRRQNTNTPLQALTLLNEVQFVEASRVLAERVTTQEENVDRQIELAYLLLTGLQIQDQVLQLLQKLYQNEYSRFSDHPEAANGLLQEGEHIYDKTLEPAHLAALTVVCNAILNFDETVTKR